MVEVYEEKVGCMEIMHIGFSLQKVSFFFMHYAFDYIKGQRNLFRGTRYRFSHTNLFCFLGTQLLVAVTAVACEREPYLLNVSELSEW